MKFLIRNILGIIFTFGLQSTVVGMDITRAQENIRFYKAQEQQKLMQSKAERFRQNFQKKTPEAQALLETDPFVLYCVYPDGASPIHIAVAQKNPDIIAWLLTEDKLNGITNFKNRKLETPLTVLVKDSVNLRSHSGGLSSPRFQSQLIRLVGEKCTLQELKKNLEIAQDIKYKKRRIMKELINDSTVVPLKELIQKKTPVKKLKPLIKNNKRKQHLMQLKQRAGEKKQKTTSEVPTQPEQGNRVRRKSFNYEYVLVNENSFGRMVEINDSNILPQGIKRLRKSIETSSR